MILLIILSISGKCVNISYSPGFWEEWNGSGFYVSGGLYDEGNYGGIMGNTEIGSSRFAQGEASTSFWRWNIGVSPYLIIPVPHKIRIGLDGGWNMLWGWKYLDPEDTLESPEALKLGNWGLWVGMYVGAYRIHPW